MCIHRQKLFNRTDRIKREEYKPCFSFHVFLIYIRIIPQSCVPRASAVISAEEIAILRNRKASFKVGIAAYIWFAVILSVYIDVPGAVKFNSVPGSTDAALEKS